MTLFEFLMQLEFLWVLNVDFNVVQGPTCYMMQTFVISEGAGTSEISS